jgi:bifunctional ADP-heptose synthase (sugar kinase/adenylyltransferase)
MFLRKRINRVLKGAISLARKCKVPIAVDPKIEYFLKYIKVTTITLSKKETVGGMNVKI